MKKILHIVEAFGGGVFTFLVDALNYLSEDYDIVVVYAKREETPKNFKEYFNKNIKFIESKYLTRKIGLLNEFKAIREIKKIVKEEKPEVVHMHSSKAGVIGRLAIKNKKIKMFYNPHGFSFLMDNVSVLKKKFYYFIEKVMAKKKCTIIGCSVGEYEEALKLRKDSININNGVNIEKIEEEIKNLKEKKYNKENIKIATIGRIDYQKNPKLFNEIAKNNKNIRFTWIGEGNLREELKENNIEITGWKTRKEVLEILNESDIFILTSLWEGLPISLLEAMYMKKVCIVSNVIGNKNVIENTKNGFIANDEKEYTNILKNINKYDIEEITRKAKEDVINNYNMKKSIQKYKDIYEIKGG